VPVPLGWLVAALGLSTGRVRQLDGLQPTYPSIKQQACNVCMDQEFAVKLRVLVALALFYQMLI
jgi:hypothetical protein